MARPATVTELLVVVQRQAAAINTLSEALGRALMGVGGMAPPPAAPVVVATEPALPDVVARVCVAVANGDEQMLVYLEDMALENLASGMAPEQVAQTIAQGVLE